MKRRNYLRRFAWLYALIVASLAVPLGIAYLYQIPHPDRASIARIAGRIEHDFSERLGPDVGPEYAALMQSIKLPTDGQKRSLLEAALSATQWNEASAPVVDEILKSNEAAFARIETLCESGGVVHNAAKPGVSGAANQNDHSYGAVVQDLTRLFRLLAFRAASQNAWGDALRWMRNSANVAAPIRATQLHDALVAISSRETAYEGYAKLFELHPTSPMLLQAGNDLEKLKSTDPCISSFVRVGELAYFISTIQREEQGSEFAVGISGLQRIRERIGHNTLGDLRPAAMSEFMEIRSAYDPFGPSTMRRYTPYPENGMGRFAIRHQPDFFMLSYGESGSVYWTSLPALLRFANEYAEMQMHDPKSGSLPKKITEGTDPWTALVYVDAVMGDDTKWHDAEIKGRILLTRGALLRESVRARITQRQTGKWPEYRLATRDVRQAIMDVAANPDQPYLPLQWGFVGAEYPHREPQMTLWSPGPDGRDDQAREFYDPSVRDPGGLSGITRIGDIVLLIPDDNR